MSTRDAIVPLLLAHGDVPREKSAPLRDEETALREQLAMMRMITALRRAELSSGREGVANDAAPPEAEGEWRHVHYGDSRRP